ncbi:hypothetical protein [Bacteroides acidifaciens]|uniref:hypothetical protein n=1 Tax=Bacteroides acidifaciens TaxID=85831 RepID=UPI003F6900DA
MKQTFYLVFALIEHYDQQPIFSHTLYANISDAKKAMQIEIEKGMEMFNGENGDILICLDTLFEWRDEDGNGITVQIEEMNVK